jgi:hypothetical protein
VCGYSSSVVVKGASVRDCRGLGGVYTWYGKLISRW